MSDLQAALAALIASLTTPVRRAVDLERQLRVDKKLAWQVFRLARSSHPVAEVQNLPARPSIERLLAAARKQHVPTPILEKVDESFQRLDRFMLVHTGDREGLVSLLSGFGGRSDEQFKQRTRKAMFRASAHFWGMHAKLLVRTSIFHAKPGPEYFEDSVLIQAAVELQRLRASQATDVVMMMRTRTDPVVPGKPGTAPIRHPPELLTQFCSGPLPEIFSPPPAAAEPSTALETRLRLPPGRTGAATVYSMQMHERISNALQIDYYGRTFVTVPTEVLVWEILLPVGWSNPSTVRGAMYGCREHPEQAFSERPADRTPQQETVEYLGALDRVPPIEGSPRHPDAVRQVLERHGWSDVRYDVYRCRVDHPVLHTVMALRIDALAR